MSSVKKNLLYQSLYEILIIILPFVTSPYISRVLGAEKIGIYSYTYSVSNYFVLFAMLGMKNYGNRMIAKNRDNQDDLNRTFSSIFFMDAIITLIVIICYLIYLCFFVKEDVLYASIQMIYVIACMFDINWFYFGMEKFKITVTRNTIIKVLTVISIFVFVKDEGDLWKYMMIMAVGSFISQSVVWFFLKDYVKIVKPTWQEMRVHIKPLIILFIPVVAVSLYNIMDKIMLGNMTSRIQVGYYENSEKAINIPKTVITAFGTVMLPRMSNLVAKGKKEQSRRYIDISMEFVLFAAFALSFGIAGVADTFAPVFWGEEFISCSYMIEVLAMAIPFWAFANVIRTQYLIPNCKDKIYIVSVFSGAVTNVIANLILIPKIGALGAVVGTVLAESSVCIIQAVSVMKELPILNYIKKGIAFFIFGLIMYMELMLIQRVLDISVLSLIIEIIVGGSTYLIISAIYLKISNNEVFNDFLNKKLKKQKI